MTEKLRINDSWVREIDGELTFCGVLESYFDQICVDNFWRAKETKKNYLNNYNNKILPALIEQDLQPLSSFTKEDFHNAIERIKEAYQKGEYSENTIRHYRHLIEVVVIVAAEHGICENVLWGSCFMLPETIGAEEKRRELVKLKKSLTAEQELRVADRLLKDYKQPGTRFGILLMFTLGLRNGEACAANFGDIREMSEANNLHVLMVYKTVESKENQLVSSGKTRNADRIIPINDDVYTFLLKRRHYIAESLKCSFEETDTLPIACDNSGFIARCVPDHLSDAGKNLFREIGLEGDILAYIDEEIEEGEDPILVREKDPTAYLFRRNFATQLHILRMSESEIEYLIGHDIENAYETRNEYVNSERLLKMKEKLDFRAVFNHSGKIQSHLICQNRKEQRVDMPLPGTIEFDANEGLLFVRLESNEPNDFISVLFCENKETEINILSATKGSAESIYDEERTVNVLKKYHKEYSKVEGQ